MAVNRIAPGQYVSLTYSIVDEAGNILEQSDLPVSFVFGSDTEMIGGMDRQLEGKGVGDKVSFEVAPEQGFGDHDPSLTFTDELENVPPQFRHVGAEVQMQNEHGEAKSFYVTSIQDGKLTVDGNHPLAGKHLRVHVTILEVRDALPGEERISGVHAESVTKH
jgi:FKBP-type peptidyl-prolyl cis-trans isomerase SlyD